MHIIFLLFSLANACMWQYGAFKVQQHMNKMPRYSKVLAISTGLGLQLDLISIPVNPNCLLMQNYWIKCTYEAINGTFRKMSMVCLDFLLFNAFKGTKSQQVCMRGMVFDREIRETKQHEHGRCYKSGYMRIFS